MKANNDVTEALQRTLNLMQGELERSVLATQMLESSTATLRATSSTHDVLSNAMDTSKQLITALQKADWIDRLIIFFGLGVFFLVTIFILKQRIFDRSMRLAFWWTRFLPSGKPPISLPVSVASSSLSKSTVASTAAASVTSLVSVAASIASSSLSPTASLDSEASTVSILESVVGLDTDTITDSIGNPTGSSDDASPLQTEDVHSIDVHDEL
jgi:protein transport protein SEC20